MATALNYIDQSLVSYKPGTPSFLQSYSDSMGNAGTAEDGFDAALNAIFSLLPAGDSMLDDLDSITGDVLTALSDGQAISADGIVSNWLGGLPALDMMQANVTLRTIGSLSVPTVTIPITTPAPPTQPCTTQPQPTTPHKTPIPVTHPPDCQPPAPCPSGYVATSTGSCEPTETAPNPPVVPPTLPQPPPTLCPEGYAPSATGDCYPTGIIGPIPTIPPYPCDPYDLVCIEQETGIGNCLIQAPNPYYCELPYSGFGPNVTQ